MGDNVHGFGKPDADPDDADRQEYYAGGASSGAAILDPTKKPSQPDIFKRLQEKAEQQGPDGGQGDGLPDAGGAASGGSGGGGHSWGGGGYSLGGEGKESAVVGGGGEAAAKKTKVITRVIITRYSDGFTLDLGDGEGEGDVRRPDKPENAMFLQSLEQGQVPMELRAMTVGGNLDVALADKSGEPAPKPKFKAFSGGGGNSLGGGNEAAKAALAAAAEAGAAAAAAGAVSWEGAKDSEPKTKVQIRLHDGQRLVAEFNHTQTVGHIRAFINASQPGMGAVTYTLATTFPRKVLTDDSSTIAAEGLLNGVVVQSL